MFNDTMNQLLKTTSKTKNFLSTKNLTIYVFYKKIKYFTYKKL